MKKEEIIYHHLGLPYPEDKGHMAMGYLNVGTFRPLQLGPEALIDVMDHYLDLIDPLLRCSALYPEVKQAVINRNFIRFRDYISTFKVASP